MRVLLLFVISWLVLLIPQSAFSLEMVTPTQLTGVNIIGDDDMMKFVEKKDVYIYDLRYPSKYKTGYIKNTSSLPFYWDNIGNSPSENRGEFDIKKLPQNKDAKIIFLSNGPEGWKSYHASKQAKESGYTRVMWYRNGVKGWVKKGNNLLFTPLDSGARSNK